MAVQAQCSSNILLCRTLQEPNNQFPINYTLPPQPAGHHGLPADTTTVLHHQTFFNNYSVGNCGTNKGKRRREDDMNQVISNISHIQSQNVDVSTGLRLSFNDHQFDPQFSGYISLSSSGNLSNLINQQEDEIQHYLQAQGEEFRRKLAEKRQRHYHALIGRVKESASRLIKDKEAVVEKAARRQAELEAQAARLATEAEVWQAKAAAQEALAAALQAELQQAVVVNGGGGCVSREEEVAVAEDAESTYVDPERVVEVSGPGCKACGKRVASVVLLPCRHLCVCRECDDVVQTCPLCLSFRSSSIEVYFS